MNVTVALGTIISSPFLYGEDPDNTLNLLVQPHDATGMAAGPSVDTVGPHLWPPGAHMIQLWTTGTPGHL